MAGLSHALGCDSTPSAPDPNPDPPSGGSEILLDYARYLAEVDPILRGQGCDAGGDCHGGGIRGSFELSPEHDKDPAFDFAQVRDQVWAWDPASSPILTEPLSESAGGTAHQVEPFDSVDDADYQAIRSWILDGEVQ
jgi:hypothetical protein